MDAPQFSTWEAMFYAFFDSLPYMLLVLYAFRTRLRFGTRAMLLLIAAITAAKTLTAPLYLFPSSALGPLYDAAFVLAYVGAIFLGVRDRFGKLVFTVLTLTNMGNLSVVLAKFLEGLLFPGNAPLRYRFTYTLLRIAVDLALVPLVYALIFRDLCPRGEESAAAEAGSAYLWRWLWLVPAVFYLIWTQHFYASGRSTLENALDPVSTGYLALIDAGSVLIYRMIVQLARTEERNRALLAENHALTLRTVQYDNLRARIEETRRARHDLRHHLVLLRSIRDSGDLAALDGLLSGFPSLEKLDRPLVYCENEAVNSVLLYFGDRAEALGVRYEVKAGVPEALNVEKTDLAVLLGNLLENALEACERVPEGERFLRVRCVLSARGARPLLTVTADNSFRVEPQPLPGGVYRSTKHSGEGVGIASVRAIAERYGGTASFRAENGVFTASAILYPRENAEG